MNPGSERSDENQPAPRLLVIPGRPGADRSRQLRAGVGDLCPNMPSRHLVGHAQEDNQQLRSTEMVQRLDAHRSAVYRAVEKGGPAAYAIRHDRIANTWP